MDVFTETLEKYGAKREKLRLFNEDKPTLLPYATLVNARYNKNPELMALHAVYEWQENPLIFLIDGDQLQDDKHFRLIRRMAAMRGDAPYLGVVRPGQLTVHRLALDQASLKQSQIKLSARQKPIVFSRLINERPGVASGNKAWISNVVLKLLRDAIDSLIKTGLSSDDAISLAGRALFTRFLADRDLLPLPLASNGETDPAQLFNDPERAKITSDWLDVTFNGDFLPLAPEAFKCLLPGACGTLSNILYRAPGGQLHLGWEEKWDYLDFAHIPVGVFSQAYEQYMRDHQEKKQRREGSYYTPRTIVELMVSGSFHALRRARNAHAAKVLDPAAGAGVFLISAFRHLVAERWQHDKKRPDTQTLRDILYEQIHGFDINEEALRFAALGLYLISIELDPHPEPVEKLRFENLRGRVLFKFSDGGGASRPLGSLGPDAGSGHAGRYDLVIGNPPWPTGTKLPNWEEVKKIVARIAKNRLPESSPPPPLPNEGLDLPFVWRAMEWARSGGQIALALHARLLFQQAEGTPEARRAVFSALDISSLVNGAELRTTKVWPGISAPFCLLFAKNQIPPPDAGFRFVIPHIEKTLNDAGALRIDASNAEIVTTQQLTERPEIFKILFRGTALDLEIFERITSRRLTTLENYWEACFGKYRGWPRQTGKGYQRPYKNEKPKAAPYLTGLPELPVDINLGLLVNPTDFSLIDDSLLFSRPRSRETYIAPLLIVKKTTPAQFGRIQTAVATEDVVFSETYYGYSTASHPNAHQLVQYLALVIGSKFSLWHALMASGEFGCEREVIEKITIDNMPLIPLEELNSSARNQIAPLFNALVQNGSEENWARADAWAAELFGLRKDDLQVISDTLKYNLPFAANKRAAQAPATAKETDTFRQTLKSMLDPWLQDKKNEIKISLAKKLPRNSPWKIVRLDTHSTSAQASDDWFEILRVADELGTAEVFLPDENNGGLWLARLKQARYWSQSQAGLVARRIVWEHMDILAGESCSGVRKSVKK